MTNKLIHRWVVKFQIISLLLFFLSCSKLDEAPMDFTSPKNYYKSVDQIESSFASSMNRLYGYWRFYDYMPYTGFVMHDDQINGGDLAYSDNLGNRVWTVHYQAIADLNPAIKAMGENSLGNTVSQQVKDELLAQAKFLRAYNYFTLVRLYGDLPLVVEDSDPISDPPGRSPISEVYSLIEADLLFAADKLPVTWGAGKEGRPSKDAARALLAKVYLTMAGYPLKDESNYVKARDMAKSVMDAGTHYLETDVFEVFELRNMWGPEMLWSFHAASNTEAIEPQIWLPGEMANGWGDVAVDRVWAENYPEQRRKHAYLLLEDWNGKSWTEWIQGKPAVHKYLYETRDNLEKNISRTNIPILRYPDVLLIFAEADNQVNNGPTQAAVDAVNLVINRANNYLPNTEDPLLTIAMSKQAFDEAVIEQRNLELCFEYDRYFDLVRKRIFKEKSRLEIQQNFRETNYLLPIPQIDLRINKELTQNPGYTTP